MRASPALLAGFLATVLAALAGAALAKGGFFIGKHEGDTLHLLDMMFRLSAGEWPHLDFVTPIGVLAFAPFALFVHLGFGAGQSILLGQTLVAIVFLPAIWWVSVSRFRGGWAYLFGAGVLVLILALVHGEAERSVSISMHYNRWAWAAAYLAIAAALLQPQGRARPMADGLVIGLMLAAMALIKVTYFAAFLPPVAVALLGRRAFATLAWTMLSGLLAAGVVTAMAGIGFWFAYLGDLTTVAASQVRPQPGLPLSGVIGSPAYMGASLMLLLAVILLRQAGRGLEGLVLLLLAPGFVYVTFQNFGNDPQWLGLLGILLFALVAPSEMRNGLGWDLKTAMGLTGAAVLAFAAPSFINLAYSPFRHLAAEVTEHLPLLPGSGRHEDLRTSQKRASRLDARIAMDGEGTPYAAYTDPAAREDIGLWRGEELPVCSVELGMVAWFSTLAADLKASGLAQDKTVFAADLLSGYWLYGAFDRLPGGAPWYYGGLPGWAAADYLIVPLCPLSTKVRKMVLEAVAESGADLTEVRRNSLYILYEK